MALFSGRASMLEVQNRALIKTAQDRALRINELERELELAGQEVEGLKAEMERLKAEMERLKAEMERVRTEVERLRAQGNAYSKKVSELEEHNGKLTEAATKYSSWGQKLERELNRIDPARAHKRYFGADDA